jgi:hypothetical protein
MDTSDLISRGDILRIFFKKPYERIEQQPALLDALEDWEEHLCEIDGMANGGLNHDNAGRRRKLVREMANEIAMSRTFTLDHPPKPRAAKYGPTRKVCFPSHEAALARAGEILQEADSPGFFRAYLCQFCNPYHLSTRE